MSAPSQTKAISEGKFFSVVIPAYNCADTIIPAIESVFSQTRRDLIEEILIVNDGSTDATDTVIRQYLCTRATPCPIRYFTQSNHGVSYSRNYAIRLAKTPWIALLDSDDQWLPNKIERQFESIQSESGIRLLGTQVRLCSSLFPKRILFRRLHGLVKLDATMLCVRALLATSSVVFHRETALHLGLFNESMQYCEDLFFFQKFLLCDGCYLLAENLVNYDCWKDFSGQSGLSSHLREMHLGRNECVKDLRRMGLISPTFERFILAFNSLKFVRRLAIQKFKSEILIYRRGGQKSLNNKDVPLSFSTFLQFQLRLPEIDFDKSLVVLFSIHQSEKQLFLEKGVAL